MIPLVGGSPESTEYVPCPTNSIPWRIILSSVAKPSRASVPLLPPCLCAGPPVLIFHG